MKGDVKAKLYVMEVTERADLEDKSKHWFWGSRLVIEVS